MLFETIWRPGRMVFFWIGAYWLILHLSSCDVDTSYQRRLTDVLNDDTIYVALHSSVGWELTVFPEGSGRLSFGSSREESLTFPKGTYHYDKLMDQIKKGIGSKKPKNDGNSVGVTFGQPGIDYFELEYLADQDLAKSIFKQAYRSVLGSKAPVYNKRRLKKRYRKEPPVE